MSATETKKAKGTPAAKKPRRSPFRPHLFDRKIEWRVQALLDQHIRTQKRVAYFLLEQCWQAGLQESEIMEKLTAFEKMPPTYSISYLRGMLLSDTRRVESKSDEAIW